MDLAIHALLYLIPLGAVKEPQGEGKVVDAGSGLPGSE